MGKGYRAGRLGEEIRKIISSMLISQIKDPRLSSMISISGVDVTKDGSYATIYVSTLDFSKDAAEKEAKERKRRAERRAHRDDGEIHGTALGRVAGDRLQILKLISRHQGILTEANAWIEKNREDIRLSEKALMSGKTTYIDKTFAPDLDTAKRIFSLAEKHGTPCMTTSALRYAEEYEPIDKEALKSLASVGGGEPDVYMIHQIEPLVMLFGTDPARVRNTHTPECPVYAVEFESGKKASLLCSKAYCSFMMTFSFADGAAKFVTVKSDFFKNFIKNLVTFYETGKVLIPHEQTLAVMAIREACIEARNCPDTWVNIRKG